MLNFSQSAVLLKSIVPRITIKGVQFRYLIAKVKLSKRNSQEINFRKFRSFCTAQLVSNVKLKIISRSYL